MWHDGGHWFLWVWVSARQRISLSVLVRNPHKVLVREISYETGRRRENAMSQSSQQKRVVSDSLGKATVRERWLLSEELGPVDPEAGSASARGRVRVPGSCVGILFEYTIMSDTEIPEKVPKPSTFVRLELTQVRACLFFLPLSVVYVVLCVCKAMWNAPGRRWEKPLDNRMAMSWFKEVEIVGTGQRVYCYSR